MKLFGTDGIRDLANGEKMNSDVAFKMGSAMVVFCQKRKLPLAIVIGRDTRESGPMLEEAIVSGIISMGGTAILAGVIPTPGISFLVREQGAGAGIVISASHNSFEYNGLKPFKNDGAKLNDQEEAEIEKYILEEKDLKKFGKDFTEGRKIILSDAKKRYMDFILKNLPAYFKADNLKLVLDCANGATYEVAPDIFNKVVKSAEAIFVDPNGKNINDNCGSQHIENLKKEVLKSGADLGLAFDGDGDRMIAVDERGKSLTGDQIIYIIAKLLKEKGELKKDTVVTTVMSNLGFVNDLKKIGIKHIATAVGDRPVFFEMKKEGVILGGEESGHVIFSDYNPAGDGIIGGLMLISAMGYFKKPLSELADEVTLYPKLLVNVKVKSKPEIEKIPEIFAIIKEVEEKMKDRGRVLVRYSGTENLCRVMIEGKDEKEINDDAGRIAKIISDHLS